MKTYYRGRMLLNKQLLLTTATSFLQHSTFTLFSRFKGSKGDGHIRGGYYQHELCYLHRVRG